MISGLVLMFYPQSSSQKRGCHPEANGTPNAFQFGGGAPKDLLSHLKLMLGIQRQDAGFAYHTRQEFVGYMGWPSLHPNALPNSSKFCTVPFTRHSPGE